jgi:hypothetical protein
MKHQRHFDTSEAAPRDSMQVRKMISDFNRTVQFLDHDITTEEERTRISDRSDAAYPLLARMMIPVTSCQTNGSPKSAGCWRKR